MAEELNVKLTSQEWPEPDEIIEAEPSSAQETLWETLHEKLSEDALNRELEFSSLGTALRMLLASPDASKNLRTIAQALSFSSEELRGLARTLKLLATGEIMESDIPQHLQTELAIGNEKARAITSNAEFQNLLNSITKIKTAAPREASPESTSKRIQVQTPPSEESTSFIPPRVTPTSKPPWEIKVQKEKSQQDEKLVFQTENATETTLPSGEQGPFILHEEKSFANEKSRPTSPGFSFPFKFFKPRVEEKPQVKATVETPESEDKPKRVVHYSELRSSIQTPEPLSPKKEPISEALKTEETKPQPKIEGNTVDLS